MTRLTARSMAVRSATIAGTVASLLALSPLTAQAQGAANDPAAQCSPTVSAALGAWDSGMAAAELFGDKALALAREKGRDYLLPLLGIDPKAVPPASSATPEGNTDDVARAIEASRNDPRRRAELCVAITRTVNEARDNAGAKLDALKRAVEGWRLPPLPTPSPSVPPAAPVTPSTAPNGTIKT
jgi:hypothetical protein